MNKILNKFKNKVFIFFNKYRRHRILDCNDKFYVQYRTLYSKQWKTYQIYDNRGYMKRCVSTNIDTARKWYKDFTTSKIKQYNFIGWNKFKQP